MQLKTQEGADITAGRAVMLYSGELSTEVEAAAEALDDVDMLVSEPIDIDIELVEEAARAWDAARQTRMRVFILRDGAGRLNEKSLIYVVGGVAVWKIQRSPLLPQYLLVTSKLYRLLSHRRIFKET